MNIPKIKQEIKDRLENMTFPELNEEELNEANKILNNLMEYLKLE